MNCSLCGKAGAAYNRPYQYDNKQITIELVCNICQALHAELIKKES